MGNGPAFDTGAWRIEGHETAPDADLVRSVWAKDDSAWPQGEDAPSDRLGWLELPESMTSEVEGLEQFAREVAEEGTEAVVLLGMGGSSLAPEVFAATLGSAESYPALFVLDSTHPVEVQGLKESIDPESTLFVVSSKSGGTVETMSLYRYFHSLIPDGRRFVAITDPGTSLAALAERDGLRALFANPPDIGGRYSALSLFGLVPAALIGAGIDSLLEGGRRGALACRSEDPNVNPGLAIGAAMGELAKAGRDKLTFMLSPELTALGDWLEQLIAESTGKHGTGIVPVVREPLVEPEAYGADRVFAIVRVPGDRSHEGLISSLRGEGHPVIVGECAPPEGLGEQMFVWEFAIAVAGAVLGVNPFDQPNVESAKKISRSLFESGDDLELEDTAPEDLFADVRPGEVAAILAFAPRTPGAEELLQAARRKLIGRGVATMQGFGPRYLHSTGQLHKGGPQGIRALVVVDSPDIDVPIPGEEAGFARLVTAQALGDAGALADGGKRVAMTSWRRLQEWVHS
ncbi:MAG TPA: glucose-6-phosphate isomerase [Actinomycetota bacterium]|jgi:glucose-6-phosphate isomerase|nr:glucose-6-phosphate isomerase [Actinomycetota bacterium]